LLWVEPGKVAVVVEIDEDSHSRYLDTPSSGPYGVRCARKGTAFITQKRVKSGDIRGLEQALIAQQVPSGYFPRK